MATKHRTAKPISDGPRNSRRAKAASSYSARKSLVLGGLLIGLLLLGLGIVLLRTGASALGAAAVLAGPVLFLLASRRVDKLTFTREDLPSLLHTWMPAALVLISVFLCAVSANDVAHRTQVENTQLAINAWVGSLVCLIVAVLWYDRWRPRFSGYRTWIRAHLHECLLVAGVLAVAIAARMLFLDQHPYPWSGDEATVGTEALRLMRSPYPDIFNSGWSGNPFPAFFPTGILEVFFGAIHLHGEGGQCCGGHIHRPLSLPSGARALRCTHSDHRGSVPQHIPVPPSIQPRRSHDDPGSAGSQPDFVAGSARRSTAQPCRLSLGRHCLGAHLLRIRGWPNGLGLGVRSADFLCDAAAADTSGPISARWESTCWRLSWP